jgi:o-succinylbenzoate synthase
VVELPIQVRRVGAHLIDLPLVRPFTTAYGTITSRRSVIVRVEDEDGAVGWGEAPIPDRPSYSAETVESAWEVLTRWLLPPVVGARLSSPAEGLTRTDVLGNNFAKHALESALWTLASASSAIPMRELLGGVREAVPVGESFGIPEDRRVETLLEEIGQRLGEGFGRVKVKIEPGWDVETVRAVAVAFPDVPLTVDANCAYRAGEPGPWEQIDELSLAMIEQPFPADDILGLAWLQSRLRTPLCLDETATSPGATAAALELGAGRIVNVKPARLGGVTASIAVHDLCRDRGVPVWCGGLLETGIGRGVNLAIASLPNFTLHADMSPVRLFYAQDLVDPTYELQPDGTVPVPKDPGVGFPVAEDRIRACEIRTWTMP